MWSKRRRQLAEIGDRKNGVAERRAWRNQEYRKYGKYQMHDQFGYKISHRLSPIARGLRGSLTYDTDSYEGSTSITKASVFLETRSNRSSSENRLQLDRFEFGITVLAFNTSRHDYGPNPNALRSSLCAILHAPTGCLHAGVVCT